MAIESRLALATMSFARRHRSSLFLLASLSIAAVRESARADEPAYFDAYGAAPSALRVDATPPRFPAFIASTDAQTGAPTFLFAIRDIAHPAGVSAGGASLLGVTREEAARIHLADFADAYGLAPASLATAQPAHTLDLGHGGIVVVFRQRVGGIDLFRSDAKVLMNRDLDLVAIGGALHPAAIASPKIAPFQITEPEAVAHAFDDLFDAKLGASDLVDTKETKAEYDYYELGHSKAATIAGIRLTTPLRVKRVYFPLPDRIVPAYYVEVDGGSPSKTTSLVYAYVIAADDGRILYRENLTHADTFTYRVWADPTGEKRPHDSPLVDYTPYPFATSNGSYPGFTAPVLVSINGFNKFMDPWLPPTATFTQGNNVDAYTDDDAPDGYSANDTRAFVTSPNTFDLPYDLTKGPQSSLLQREASITSLFYTTNWLHDWWYDSGFDEADANAQSDNYGRGGVAGDPLHAEGQDGAPTQRNNSDMSVPADGASPRMQMFVWDGAQQSLTIQPGNVALAEGQADFGPTSFLTTGSVVLVDDGTAPTTDACQPIMNNVAGQIALIDRGTCSFKFKAANAQASGAIGVILVDNQAGGAPHLFDDPAVTTTITIPNVSVSQSDGMAIKTALANGATTATIGSAFDVDGTIDNTVVAHEWGHYLHLRHVACGSPACSAESEGWADFNALMTITREGDDLDGAFALAQYAVVSFPDPAYFGIRRFPYSVDFTKDPLTFKNITSGQALPTTAPVSPTAGQSDNSEAHASGEIWASMLFESYVGLLKASQGPTPPYSFTEARRRMGDYVVSGMSLAPANPTYTEQRDGVLAAAAAADPNDLAILAKGFATRGAGTCAVSPARDSTDFTGVVESFTVVPNLSIDSIALDDSVTSCDSDGYLDAGETGKITVHVTNNGAAAAADATATVTTDTPGVTFPNGPQIDFGALGVFSAKSASIDVALDPSVKGKQLVHLKVTSDAAGCSNATREEYFPANVDEAESLVGDRRRRSEGHALEADRQDDLVAHRRRDGEPRLGGHRSLRPIRHVARLAQAHGERDRSAHHDVHPSLLVREQHERELGRRRHRGVHRRRRLQGHLDLWRPRLRRHHRRSAEPSDERFEGAEGLRRDEQVVAEHRRRHRQHGHDARGPDDPGALPHRVGRCGRQRRLADRQHRLPRDHEHAFRVVRREHDPVQRAVDDVVVDDRRRRQRKRRRDVDRRHPDSRRMRLRSGLGRSDRRRRDRGARSRGVDQPATADEASELRRFKEGSRGSGTFPRGVPDASTHRGARASSSIARTSHTLPPSFPRRAALAQGRRAPGAPAPRCRLSKGARRRGRNRPSRRRSSLRDRGRARRLGRPARSTVPRARRSRSGLGCDVSRARLARR